MNRLSIGITTAFLFSAGEVKLLKHGEIMPVHLFLGALKLIDSIEALSGDKVNLPREVFQILEMEVKSCRDTVLNHFDSLTKYRRSLRLELTCYPGIKDETRDRIHRSEGTKAVFRQLEELPFHADIKNLLIILLKDKNNMQYAVKNPEEQKLLTDLLHKLEGKKSGSHTSSFFDTVRTQVQEPDFGQNWIEAAQRGAFHDLYDRDDLIRQMYAALMQKSGHHILLEGPLGVGKRSMIKKLAYLIGSGDFHRLSSARLVEMPLGMLLSQAEKAESLEEVMKRLKGKGLTILYLSGVEHFIKSTGHLPSGTGQILELFDQKGIRIIFVCESNSAQAIRQLPGSEHQFTVFQVPQFSDKETIELLEIERKYLVSYYNTQFQIRTSIPRDVIVTAVAYAGRFISGKVFPAKAIDLLDTSLALKIAGQPEQSEYRLSVEDLKTTLMSKYSIREDKLLVDDNRQTLNLPGYLADSIKGQEEAIKTVSEILQVALAGLKDRNKPRSVFLLAGPTGVGKTFLAKKLAEYIYDGRMLHLNMSEFMERHQVSRLLGAPPGFVGYDDPPLLVDPVARDPEQLVLFDEIEKAHKDIQKIFLQIFEEGRLTASNGQEADFSKTIVVMTSNLGAVDGFDIKPQRALGFQNREENESVPQYRDDLVRQAIKRFFLAEVINRIDKIIVMNPLDHPAIEAILDRIIQENQLLLDEHNIQLHIPSVVREFIIQRGFNPEFGSRFLQRAFDELVKGPLSRFMLEKEGDEPAHITAELVGDRVTIHPALRSEIEYISE